MCVRASKKKRGELAVKSAETAIIDRTPFAGTPLSPFPPQLLVKATPISPDRRGASHYPERCRTLYGRYCQVYCLPQHELGTPRSSFVCLISASAAAVLVVADEAPEASWTMYGTVDQQSTHADTPHPI